MTHQISLMKMKMIGLENIEDLIYNFAKEKQEWVEREILVEKTKDEEDPTKKYASYPPPTAHGEVMAAVNESGDPDYEIVDDMHVLNAAIFIGKKNELFNLVSKTENDEKQKVVPAGKERFWRLKEQSILDMDSVVRRQVQIDYYNKEEEVDILKLEEYIIQQRTPENQKFMEAQAERADQLKHIDLWGAEQHSEIADLTDETIDTWKMKPYSA